MSFANQYTFTRENFMESLAERVLQNYNEPRSKATRNIGIIDHKWFLLLLRWINDENAPDPPKILNEDLLRRIENHEMLNEKVDYDLIELNVANCLFKIFGGDKNIMRPYVFEPETNQAYVIFSPIKFDVCYNGNRTIKTVDPKWALRSLKLSLCKKFVLDPTKFNLQNNNGENVDENMSCNSYLETYGKVIHLALQIMNTSSPMAPQPNYVKLGFNKYKSLSTSNYTFSIPSAQTSTSHCNISETSFPTTFLQMIARIPELSEYVRSEDCKEKTKRIVDNPIFTNFIEYVNSVNGNPNHMIIPSALVHLLSMKYKKFSKSVTYQVVSYFRLMLSDIHDELNPIKFFSIRNTQYSNESWEKIREQNQSILFELLYGQQQISGHCKMCHKNNSIGHLFCGCTLPVVKKHLGKTSIRKCFNQYSTKTSEPIICEFCGSVLSKLHIKIEKHPKYLILHLTKHQEKLNVKVSPILDLSEFSVNENLNAVYDLKALIFSNKDSQSDKNKLIFRNESGWKTFKKQEIVSISDDHIHKAVTAHTFLYMKRE
ncbi:hypothetical protein TRFO_26945 [Tritrichomonas foetus]|uniref:USP domain-containing protein n=1 Tax=Tritrichomonas foetus TaxID=1144522 RepID=A0A1J4K2X8_9EUKA|nr:hypothetical protein TRFO_26945 [Tritrichomonas foetus]|eukprot:OHT05322.1 hypothetical protein TRFO_26945 [Tritrichomonas foetus]